MMFQKCYVPRTYPVTPELDMQAVVTVPTGRFFTVLVTPQSRGSEAVKAVCQGQ